MFRLSKPALFLPASLLRSGRLAKREISLLLSPVLLSLFSLSPSSSPCLLPAPRVFTTVEEFSTYCFPKGRPEKEVTRGKERGAKAAKNAFTEIGNAL